MSDVQTLSIEELANSIRSNPANANRETEELISRVQNDSEGSRMAMFTLNNLAHESPRTLRPHVKVISSCLYHADTVGNRSQLTEVLSEVVAEFPDTGDDAKRGFTEATRLRKQRIEGKNAYDEVQTVRKGLEAWVDLAEQGYTVPDPVVENAVKVIQVADSTTLLASIQLLEEAVYSGTQREDTAVRALYDLANIDDELTRRNATAGLARLYVTGEINGHQEEIRTVLKNNQELTDEPAVETAISDLTQ